MGLVVMRAGQPWKGGQAAIFQAELKSLAFSCRLQICLLPI